MKFITAFFLAGLACGPTQAADALPTPEAATWLQKISNAANQMTYEGFFTFHIGGGNADAHTNGPSQTLMVSNHPNPHATENTVVSRLLTLDGSQREVRCTQQASFTMKINGAQIQSKRRLGKRHFPELLPADTGSLVNWYGVRLGNTEQIAGHDCTNVEIIPKDIFRWGYVMCIDNRTSFPLRAVLVNEAGESLMQYRFTELKLNESVRTDGKIPSKRGDAARALANERVTFNDLPPGFSRIIAARSRLHNHPAEVEHWVFSDGLTHVSLFLEPTRNPVNAIKGQSRQGHINMMKRSVGDWQATVLGEAPMATVEAISMGLQARP